jgi:hypothetical protein
MMKWYSIFFFFLSSVPGFQAPMFACDVSATLASESAVLAPAKRMTGETVLGHYPAYAETAEQTGAR